MEISSFPIFDFSQALSNLICGHDIARNNIRLRLDNETIMMVFDDGTESPWLPTHIDILAKDWKVIKRG